MCLCSLCCNILADVSLLTVISLITCDNGSCDVISSVAVVHVIQVEDVDKKFVELNKLKASDWVMARQSPVKPKRVMVSSDHSLRGMVLCD